MQISKHIPKNIKTYKQEKKKNIEAHKRQCLGLSAFKAIIVHGEGLSSDLKSYVHVETQVVMPAKMQFFKTCDITLQRYLQGTGWSCGSNSIGELIETFLIPLEAEACKIV